MPDLRAYAREAATRAGCDPDLFERQIQQESGFDPDAYNPISGATGIAQIVARFHPDVDPRDPIASLEYAARWMARLHQQYGSYRFALAAYNWGPGNVSRWDGRRETLPAETQRYLDVILGPAWAEPATLVTREPDALHLRVTDNAVRVREQPSLTAPILLEVGRGTLVTATSPYAWRQIRVADTGGWIASSYLEPAADAADVPPALDPGQPRRLHFDATTPTELQVQNWTCSIRSVMWLLKSIGIRVTPAEAQDIMAPAYVNSDVGLKDASGAGIVEVLRDAWGVMAFNRSPVSFDEVAGWAGHSPVAIGGRNWCHWTAVRGTTDDPSAGAVLVLANPGGTGPRYGHQTLNRQQFADLGWFSAVVVPVE
jgi:hypothetical protein